MVQKGGGTSLAATLGGPAQQLCKYFLQIRIYKDHYSVVKGYFRFNKLSRNCYFTKCRVVKLHVDFTSRLEKNPLLSKNPPLSYRFTCTPLFLCDEVVAVIRVLALNIGPIQLLEKRIFDHLAYNI